jgi:hypothetical protein
MEGAEMSRVKAECTTFKDADGKPIITGQSCRFTFNGRDVIGEVMARFLQKNIISVYVQEAGCYYTIEPFKVHMVKAKEELDAMINDRKSKVHKTKRC